MKKTAKYWIDQLPEPQKSQALENINYYYNESERYLYFNSNHPSFFQAISCAFSWKKTPQGYAYWSEIAHKFKTTNND